MSKQPIILALNLRNSSPLRILRTPEMVIAIVTCGG